jgi:SEC-C motif-containing protein
MSEERCPCGRARPFAACCEPYITGRALPPTAEDLMRSRYAAYATGAVDYLWETHDPARRGGVDKAAIARAAAGTRWHELKVLGAERGGPGDDEGTVLFEARYTLGPRPATLRENAEFRRVDGRWVYVGETKEPPVRRAAPKVGRNDPCPCGSGRKYKQCCGR